VASHASPYVPGLIAAYSLSRHGQRGSYAKSGTPQNLSLGLRLRMGHKHGGLTDATACDAAERKTIRRGPTGRARALNRLSTEVRQQLLAAIYAGQPFRQVICDLGLTSNQVWGLAKPGVSASADGHTPAWCRV
jgi:hypothetical protein